MDDYALGAIAALGVAIAGSSFAEIVLDSWNLMMKVTDNLETTETVDHFMEEVLPLKTLGGDRR